MEVNTDYMLTALLQTVLSHLKIFWEQASLFALVIFGLHCAFFLCFFILGLSFRGLASTLFHLIALVFLFATPFGVRYTLEQQLFKIQATVQQAFSFTYTSAFVAKVHIKNQGYLPIHKCFLRLDVLLPSANKFQSFLHQWVFAHSYIQTFQLSLPPHKEQSLVMNIEPYPYKQASFKLSSACH
ncbi:DUF2393 family protein [Helicobacter suis]|uniref:DUF2393 family protein n=1 Tax=Helicobacter suis TaxID=104628 RepID=UPI001F074F99|nr:DUF2393 family protein [Helicobacter suis]